MYVFFLLGEAKVLALRAPTRKRTAFGRFSARNGDGLFALGAMVAVAFDDDGLCVMQKTIQQSGGHGGVTGEDSWPVFQVPSPLVTTRVWRSAEPCRCFDSVHLITGSDAVRPDVPRERG
jgi:hypothetical protein